MFSMNILEEMFEDLGYIDGRLLFTHFRILGQSLDEGLLPPMSDEDVIRFLEYVPRFRDLEVYIEIGVSLVKRHMIEGMTSKGKGVMIEEIMDHDVNDVVGKEFDSENGNSRKLPLEFPPPCKDSIKLPDDVEFEHGMEDNLYDDFDSVMYDTNNGTSISGKVWYLETCLRDEKGYLDDICGVAQDGVDLMIKELDPVDDRDVNPNELYAKVVAQEGVDLVDDKDVIPNEVVAEEM
ncbi:hypothetical protein Tco_0133100 [Tanacetum coccineum]